MKRALCVLSGIFLLAGATALRGAGPDTQWLGVLWTKGAVDVGNTRVTSGTTLLPGDIISTGQDSSAWVRFRTPASTLLLADTSVTMVASDSGPSLFLRHGSVVVDQKVTDPVQVGVPGGMVTVKGDPQTGAECELAMIGDDAMVTVKRGYAQIQSRGTPVILQAGQSTRVAAHGDAAGAGPQAGGARVAGKINRVIPQGEIQRAGQVQELPLQLNEVIDWNDLVRTLSVGRAQIQLLDGSTLNVGARTEIKVIKHDPQAQQTQVELAVGTVTANVQKVTAPGGKFEMTTKSALIGTIDTAFVAETDEHKTRVCGLEGVTQVQSSDPNIPKTVKLRRNECTVVFFGAAPTDPVLAPGELAQILNGTIIGGATGGGLGTAGTLALVLGLTGGAGAAILGVVLATSGSTSPTTP